MSNIRTDIRYRYFFLQRRRRNAHRTGQQDQQRDLTGPSAVIGEPRFGSRAEAADVPAYQAAFHEQPVITLLDQPVRGAPRLLHQRATWRADPARGASPARARRSTCRRTRSGYTAAARRTARQRSGTATWPGRRSALAVIAAGAGPRRPDRSCFGLFSGSHLLKVVWQVVGSALSCRSGMPWFSHQSSAST